ncbi:SURF1 family protein [Propioniferax innocua]|uniref:SURF1-like protein n=1 Tax=Propioniferax innocua TaxID=1753 RepID=A0A542ZAA9_9ACTN|nr:SURF1 family protein [Propioniferax innocua]TQL57277.1 cytochrome oxidase assembly protein ShyY1 [Propioniferax innocua]
MRRLYLRWLGLLVFVLVLGIAFVNLGQWQLRRLEQRQSANAVVIANQNRPPIPYSDVADQPITDEDEWQRVTVTGTFDAEHQFIARYRVNDETPGIEVVTPLELGDGRALLVDRGFIPVERGQPMPETAPAPPTGEVTITAHLRPSENGRRNALEPVNGQIRLINSDALAEALPHPVQDGYVSVLEMTPPQEGGFVPVALPELSEGPHFWYAVQWFMFTGIALVGLVVFIRGDIRERRRGRDTSTNPAPEPDTNRTD